MTTVYLIRHAEAEGNLYRISQGQQESLITQRGLAQIEALERRFADIPVDAVYASDLYRTRQTAGAVYIPRRLPLHRETGLREICMGEWEGRTWGEIAWTDPEQLRNFFERLDQWRAPGAETLEQLRDRTLDAFRRIVAENEGKTVALFSHGIAIRTLLTTLAGGGLEDVSRLPLAYNTAVAKICVDGDRIEIVYQGDISHLTEDLIRKSKKTGTGKLNLGLRFLAMQADEARNWCSTRGAAMGTHGAWVSLQGWHEEEPTSVVCLDTERGAAEQQGWIAVAFVEPSQRALSYGTQLVGQAVQYYRQRGRRQLCVEVPAGDADALAFFAYCGFQPEGDAAEGRIVLSKGIAFADLPEFC